MNIMGMGIMELGVVLMIGFLVLGPSRSIDTARTAGKFIGDLRRSFNEIMEAVNMERDLESGPSGRVPVTHPDSSPVQSISGEAASAEEPSTDTSPRYNPTGQRKNE